MKTFNRIDDSERNRRRIGLNHLLFISCGFLAFTGLAVLVEGWLPPNSRGLVVIYASVAMLLLPVLPYPLARILPGPQKGLSRVFAVGSATLLVWGCLLLISVIAGVNFKLLLGRGL